MYTLLIYQSLVMNTINKSGFVLTFLIAINRCNNHNLLKKSYSLYFILIFLMDLCLFINAQSTQKIVQFEREPGNKKVVVGDDILLPCKVTHKVGEGRVQWTRDGFGLGTDRSLKGFSRYEMTGSDAEGDYSLRITNVTLEDDATFQCQIGASKDFRGLRSSNSVVEVRVRPELPKILPGNYLKTTAGMKIELTCEANGGKPPAELRWLDSDDNPVKDDSIYKTVYKTQLLSDGKRENAMLKLTFQPTRQHHGKTFSCQSENPTMKKPDKAYIRLEVKYPPEIQLTRNKETVLENEDIHFQCEAIANPNEIIYKWYKNNELINGDNGKSLILHRVSKDLNKAEITCEASNSVGTTKKSIILDIRYGPIIKPPIKSTYAAVEGDTVTLRCDVDGNPKPEVSWIFNDSPNILGTDKELVITNIKEENTGKYTCRTVAAGFPEVSRSLNVYIKGPPKIISPSMQYVLDGDTAKVECLVHSVTSLKKIVWMQNSQIVHADNDKGLEIIEDTPSESRTRNILVVHKTDDDSLGNYNCSAWNDYGNDYMIITLTKQKSFPVLVVIGVIIGGVILVVSVTIVIILCLKRKNPEDDYSQDMKKDNSKSTNTGSLSKNTNSVIDTGSSGADSDAKLEIRTTSSLSERGHWDDINEGAPERNVSNEIAQVVENIYNYASEPVFATKDTCNNNGYIPYMDFNHDYMTNHRLTTDEQVPMQHASIILTNRDSLVDAAYGSYDPTFRSYNSYITNPNNIAFTPSGATITSSGLNTALLHNNKNLNSGIFANNQRYITSLLNNQHQIKHNTLATHV